jgi:hypothetical protein
MLRHSLMLLSAIAAPALAQPTSIGRPRRWVVERTGSWCNRFRALLVRWEVKAVNYLALFHLACAVIALQHS